MNQSSAINIWKGTNRVSLLWEDLLTYYVSPDPPIAENPAPDVVLDSMPARSEQDDLQEPSLLERAGFESLRLIRQALEILTAPPEVEPGAQAEQETLQADRTELDVLPLSVPMQADSSLGLTFVKVSSEPDPQPGSAIDTRRVAYGLKIPTRPLHKRPFYQRIFFCLQHFINRTNDASFPH